VLSNISDKKIETISIENPQKREEEKKEKLKRRSLFSLKEIQKAKMSF